MFLYLIEKKDNAVFTYVFYISLAFSFCHYEDQTCNRTIQMIALCCASSKRWSTAASGLITLIASNDRIAGLIIGFSLTQNAYKKRYVTSWPSSIRGSSICRSWCLCFPFDFFFFPSIKDLDRRAIVTIVISVITFVFAYFIHITINDINKTVELNIHLATVLATLISFEFYLDWYL